jgi:hypothetical protein
LVSLAWEIEDWDFHQTWKKGMKLQTGFKDKKEKINDLA